MIRITIDWLKENNYNSVTDYCRDLIKDENFKENTIEVYRGEMLSYTVDVQKAAKIVPDGNNFRPYRALVKGV